MLSASTSAQQRARAPDHSISNLAIRTMLSKLFFLAFAVFTLLHAALALQEQAKCEYNAVVAKRCGANTPTSHPDCCFASPGTCAVTYKVAGNWLSEVESPPSLLVCKNLCNKHFRACRGKCKCLAGRKAIRDGRLCKCIPNDLDLIKRSCDLSCKIGRKKCLLDCKNSGPCAIAKTQVTFFRSYRGRCGRISCGPPFIGTRPRVCPICKPGGICSLTAS